MGDGTSIAPWCGGQLRVEGARGNGPGAGVCAPHKAYRGRCTRCPHMIRNVALGRDGDVPRELRREMVGDRVGVRRGTITDGVSNASDSRSESEPPSSTLEDRLAECCSSCAVTKPLTECPPSECWSSLPSASGSCVSCSMVGPNA